MRRFHGIEYRAGQLCRHENYDRSIALARCKNGDASLVGRATRERPIGAVIGRVPFDTHYYASSMLADGIDL